MTMSPAVAVRRRASSTIRLAVGRCRADAYYGIHTARALENFPISGIPLSAYPEFVNALAAVKQAAAVANCELGLLDRRTGRGDRGRVHRDPFGRICTTSSSST